MKAIVSTSRIVFLTALLGMAVAGCDRTASDQASGAAGTSESVPANTAPTPGGVTTTPDDAEEAGVSDAKPSNGSMDPAMSDAPMGNESGDSRPGGSGMAGGLSGTQPDSSSGERSSSETEPDTTSPTSGLSGFDGAAASAENMIDDSVITTKVKAALLSDATVSGTKIGVETQKGEVMLSGAVDQQEQMDKAVHVASTIEGVRKVNNNMSVKK